MDASAYDFKRIPELTPEQKKDPYAAFYYEPVKRPPERVLAVLGEEQMDVCDSFSPEGVGALLTSDASPRRNGWCIRPDGTGFSLVEIEWPGVTEEMLKWWDGWYPDPHSDFLNYRIWMPGLHESHSNPLVENLGWGMLKLYPSAPFPMKSVKLSGDPEEQNPVLISRMGVFFRIFSADQPEEEPYCLLVFNCVKKTADGAKIQYAAFSGMKVENGRAVKAHDADPDKVRLFAMHNAFEFQREGDLLPRMYRLAKNH